MKDYLRLASLVLWLWLTAGPGQASDRVYTFGISPQNSPTELAEAWTPVLAWLSEKSGIRLRFATANSSSDFSKRLAQGQYDFCYVNPQQYTLLHESPGYVAFAREKGRRLKGILVVNGQSRVAAVQDLQGSTLAFPSPTSFAASVLPQAELRKQGISFTPKYVNSHESVYLNVSKGSYPAGGGIIRTFELAEPEVRDKLRVLFTTRGYTPHAFAAHPRVNAAERDKLQAAMLLMGEDEAGSRLLASINFKGMEAGADGDWNDIRALNLPQGD